MVICPHTATAFEAYKNLNHSENWVVVATAHPSKFPEIVQPLISQTIKPTVALRSLLASKAEFLNLDANSLQLKEAILKNL